MTRRKASADGSRRRSNAFASSISGTICRTTTTGRSVREIEATLATLPARSTDTLVAFDESRVRLLSMPEAIAEASDQRRAEIVGLLVERVMATRTTGLTGLQWTAPAAPFFRLVLSERAVWADGPRSRHDETDDPLAWYAEQPPLGLAMVDL